MMRRRGRFRYRPSDHFRQGTPLASVLLSSNELMLFNKRLLAAITSSLIATPALAAGLSETQMPKSSFDGVHNTRHWDPSSLNRMETLHAQSASNASWYGVPDGFHGRRTANGETFNAYGRTAAHRSLPFGTRLRVTNLRNGRSVVVRVNDRGPYVHGRDIDLSQGAAAQIGMISSGTAPVRIEVLR